MRPVYENAATREAEEALIREVFRDELAAGWRLVKLPRSHGLDYAIVHSTGELIAFVEAKCRTGDSTRHTSYMIAATKVLAAERWYRLTGRPVWLLVGYESGPARIRQTRLDPGLAEPAVNRLAIRWGMGGRADRHDPADYEVCAYIPMERFISARTDEEAA